MGGRIDEEDARPSSSKGKGDGHAKDDEGVVKSDLPHVSAGLPGDGITYVNDDGKEAKIDKAGRSYPVGKDGFRLMKTTRPPEYPRRMCDDEKVLQGEGRGERWWQEEERRTQKQRI